MDKNILQNRPKIKAETRKNSLALFMLSLAVFSLVFTNICFAYVTPDWAAIARANERQKPHSSYVTVNYEKQTRDNKKQEVSKKFKTNKVKDKRNNKKQKVKSKKYKYNRKAELKRNARQEVR